MQQHVVKHGECHKRQQKSCHPLHPGLAPDTVLPLDPARSGRDSEIDSARLSLTIIQFTAYVILISNTQSQQAHICKSYKSPEETLEAAVADLHTGLVAWIYIWSLSSTGNWAAELSNWADLFRVALLTPLAWTLLKLTQLRWTGYVTRMPDECLPKKILYGELQIGKSSHGGQKKRYKDTLKASLKVFNVPAESREQIAQDWTKWLGLIRRGAGKYKAKRISKTEQKPVQRKTRANASPTELSSSDLSCAIYNRQFRPKIGLISHLKTHK